MRVRRDIGANQVSVERVIKERQGKPYENRH